MGELSQFEAWHEDKFGKQPEWTEEDEARLDELVLEVSRLEERLAERLKWLDCRLHAVTAWHAALDMAVLNKWGRY